MISGGAREVLGGLELTLGVDDLRPALALGLGLTSHRALHRLGDLDVLELNAHGSNTEPSIVTMPAPFAVP